MPSPLPCTPCHLNGVLLPLDQAQVSVLDRGFIFGDGAYEVVPAYGKRLFRLEQHLDRLARSLGTLRIVNPYTHGEWHARLTELLGHPDCPDSAHHLLYIQVTRGVAPRDHVMPQGLTPTVFIMVNPMNPVPTVWRSNGVACVTAADFRWHKGHIKSTSLLGAVLARQISADAGAVETVMFRGDWLTEGAACNIWMVKNGAVFGVPNDGAVLEGIRYGLIGELCQDLGIGFNLRPIHRDEVLQADELWLSSASKEVVPITHLDGQPVGNGLPGPIYSAVYRAYQAEIASMARP